MTTLDDRIITFLIGSRHLGVRSSMVREFTIWSPPKPVADTPDYFLGLMEHHRETFPMLDLSRLLGWKPTQLTDRHAVMILETARGPRGFVVDWIGDILFMAQDLQAPLPDSTLVPAELLDGIAAIGARRIEIIGFDKLTYESETLELA